MISIQNINIIMLNNHNQDRSIGSLLGILIFLFGVICVHEMSHIIIARIQNIYVKKVGFKLKYYIFPIFYVKIFPTLDNHKKANVAFAGLVADMFLLLVYEIIYHITGLQMIRFALGLQFIMSIYNYNLLLPTDFTNAVAQFFKVGNFRKQAFDYTKSLLTFNKNIKISKKKRLFYISYSLLFILLLGYFSLNILSQIFYIIRSVKN